MTSEICSYNPEYFVYIKSFDTIYHGKEKPEQTTQLHHTVPWASVHSCFRRYIFKDGAKTFDGLHITLKQTVEDGGSDCLIIKDEKIATCIESNFQSWLSIKG